MKKQINIIETLDWYTLAGVTETFADEPCLTTPPAEKKVLFQKENQSQTETKSFSKNISNPAVILTEATSTVLKNAKDICSKATSLAELKEMVASFEGCHLKSTAATTVFGEGNSQARLMLIGEAPGADEDRQGRPFVGRCGKLLDKMLSAINFTREECYITNVLPWRPPGNRTPTDDEIAICLPFLKRQIELIAPDIILLLGGIALKSVTDNPDSISRTRGKWLSYNIENKEINVLATYHPSYVLRSSAQKAKVWADLLRLKKKFAEMK